MGNDDDDAFYCSVSEHRPQKWENAIQDKFNTEKKQTCTYFFLHSSRLSDRANTVVKEAGDITLEPVANNGKYLNTLDK